MALCSCGSPVPERIASASPSAQRPVFSSGEEALAEARATYAEYLRVGQAVSEDGGRDVDRFTSVLTPTALAEEEKGAELLRDRKLTTVGPSKLVAFKLERADLVDGSVRAYACVDLSKVRVITAGGRDVTPASRPNLQTSRPSFVWQAGALKLKADETWSGSSIC